MQFIKRLTNVVKLQGEISLESETVFSVNGIGYRKLKVVSGERFDIQDNHDAILIFQDDVPVYRLDARKALLIRSDLENGKFITTLQTF